eukprot:Seg4379.2 transcript_id=Seg4379.2/GoldUCD/mRNA.D3Y31 product="hypothetical protein" protein_id=Seg4379.2/GoldUCD/D3Y31
MLRRNIVLKIIAGSGKKRVGQKVGFQVQSIMQERHTVFCDKTLVAGKSELVGHTKSILHVQQAKAVKENRPMSSFITVKDSSTIKAELNVVALISRKNISLNFLDSLVLTPHGIANDSKGIKGMTCNRTKGTYLVTECLSVFSHGMLVADLKKSRGFPIVCDKATDITMNKVFCVNVRFLESSRSEPVTRFRLIPIEEGDATGLLNSLKIALEKDDLAWERVTGYASDDPVLVALKDVNHCSI